MLNLKDHKNKTSWIRLQYGFKSITEMLKDASIPSINERIDNGNLCADSQHQDPQMGFVLDHDRTESG